MGKNPDVIESAHMVLHLMKAGMAIYGYPAVAIHRGMVQKNGELIKNFISDKKKNFSSTFLKSILEYSKIHHYKVDINLENNLILESIVIFDFIIEKFAISSVGLNIGYTDFKH